ncbi:hypothetical protein LC087_11935 [Bacillus carboniphilus]|uniref:SWIM-type domain-containing protein n=1 Tax=Bacillus carboniphilus TaxID=86663 RepID=A0ABY9JQD1_9BACI|nr:hypothetical protein [Bacillus carboniphilus]WLR41591.1 hypothetical protein LC087_11935 [Bacillus carboniphilus]
MPTYGIPKESILTCSKELVKLLPPSDLDNQEIIKDGLHLYRDGRVYNASIEFLTAKVQASRSESVRLSLDHFEESRCSCSDSGICSHMIAFFLYLYAKVDTVGTYVKQWRNPLGENPLEMFKKLGLLKKGIDIVEEEEEEEEEEISVDSWYKQFEAAFQEWDENTNKRSIHHVVQSFYHQYTAKLKRKAPRHKDFRELYFVHVALSSFNQLTKVVEKLDYDEASIHHYVIPYLDQYFNEIIDLLPDIQINKHNQSLLEGSIKPVQKLLLNEGLFPYFRLHIYREAWSSLLNQEHWLINEKERLNGMKGDNDEFYGLAIAHIEFLLKEDQAALDRLKPYGGSLLDYTLLWLEDLYHQEDWIRFKKYVPYVMEQVPAFLRIPLSFERKYQSIDQLLDYFSLFMESTGDQATFESLCKQTLPFSYKQYDLHLLNEKKYKRWIELQTVLKFQIDDLHNRDLIEVGKEDPEAIIPVLHQRIDYYIQKKNRSSYQEAVYYLKVLRNAYTHAKQHTDWNDFIYFLREKYKRLRAFQEELERGFL